MRNHYQNLQQTIHSHNVTVGWWDDKSRWLFVTKCMLTVSEVAEAMEGDRKGLMDDKLPHRGMLEVELADVMIRALDIGGHSDYSISPHIEDMVKDHLHAFNGHNNEQPVTTPVVLFQIVNCIVIYANEHTEYTYNSLISCIHAAGVYLDLNLKDAITEKRTFNATRADHRREERIKPQGKTY